LIVCTITPEFVIIPGTTQGDYKDFSYHLKAHARSLIGLLVALLRYGVIHLDILKL